MIFFTSQTFLNSSCSLLLPLAFRETNADVPIEDDLSLTILDQVLNESKYDKRRRPLPTGGGPTQVQLDVFVRSIYSINQVSMVRKTSPPDEDSSIAPHNSNFTPIFTRSIT